MPGVVPNGLCTGAKCVFVAAIVFVFQSFGNYCAQHEESRNAVFQSLDIF